MVNGLAKEPGAREGGSGSIRFAGALDLRAYRRAHWLALWGMSIPWIPMALAALLLAAGLVLLALGKPVDAAVYGGAGLLGGLSLVAQEAAIRRVWQSHALAREPAQGWLDNTGFHVRSALGETHLPWDRLFQAKSSRALLLLYQSAALFLILSESHFASPDDWQAAKALVSQKLPAAPKLRMGRVIWAVTVATFALLGLLLLWARWDLG